MKEKIKIIKVTDDTIVAFGAFDGVGCGTMMLNTKGKTKNRIETDIVWRFRSQISQKKADGESVSFSSKNIVFEWFDNSEIVKANHGMFDTEPKQKPKIYSIEKKLDGSLKVNKIEGKLYDEDEVKIALCQMALNGEK